jgi:hypothetical protein
MAYTYSKIASVTVGSGGSSSINFIAIPQNYTDLLVMASIRTQDATNSSEPVIIRPNNSTSSLYSIAMYGEGSGSGLSLTRSTNSNVSWADTGVNTGNTFANMEWYLPNYTSNNYKSISNNSVQENNATAAIAAMSAILWSNASAITSLSFVTGNGNNFAQYSTATLYGIKAEV